jgi:aspartate carbamoyltransferase catalytic subunit
MTRIQRERFDDLAEYERLKDNYILTVDKLETAKKDMIIMHPLPRVNEISVKVDDDPRACYFKQCLNGKYMRMALILLLLDIAKKNPVKEDVFAGKGYIHSEHKCDNPKCVSAGEQELEPLYKKIDEEGHLRCVYCDIGEPSK